MDAHNLVHGYREHPERIVLPQIILGRERKSLEVAELFQIVGVNARRVELVAIVCDPLIADVQRVLEARELQAAQLVDAGFLDPLDLIDVAHTIRPNGAHAPRRHNASTLWAAGYRAPECDPFARVLRQLVADCAFNLAGS